MIQNIIITIVIAFICGLILGWHQKDGDNPLQMSSVAICLSVSVGLMFWEIFNGLLVG